ADRQVPVPADPGGGGQSRLQPEEHQTGNPRDDRQHAYENRQPGEGVAPARQRAAEIERQRVVRKIRRDQAGSREGGEKHREASLDVHEDREEPAVDLNELTKPPVESLQQLGVIAQVDEARAQNRPYERQDRQQEDETLLIEPSPGVTRQHEKSGPATRERT